MGNETFMVQIQGLEKFFGDERERVHVLKGVSLDVPEGSLYTFLGPSGCGKTTTLRCIAGLERPEEGRVCIDDRTVFSSEERAYVPPNRRPIGMVFQSYAIWPHMTVFENVAYPLAIRRRPKAEIQQRVREVLKVVGLQGLEDRPAPKLSGGQQQRVAFARALVNEPKVLLLDEPLSNLDAKLREQMRFEIKSLQRRVNITTIYVTHDQAEAMAISDQIAVMHAGRLVEVGNPRELYSRPKRRFTATFLGLTNLIEGRVLQAGRNSELGRMETKQGTFLFVSSTPMRDGQGAVLSIRPEHMQVHVEKPEGLDNVVEGVIKESVFMGDAFHCQIGVKDQLMRVHTHPLHNMAPGEKVYLHLDPQCCNGLPVEDTESVEESILGV